MKNLIFALSMLNVGVICSQVGIGTLNPSSQLEIKSTNTGIPSLELNPQTTPLGSATGQLSVIGDELSMYDAARGKWLSLQATPLQWSKNGNAGNETLRFGGDTRSINTGASMPFDGTIVYVTANAEGGNATKGFEIRIKSGTTLKTTTSFNLVGSTFKKTDYNVNFSAGDYINVFANNTGGDASDPAVIVWVKWRK
ncbi:MAG: hypothetical protein CMC14_03710 [Flavobacteriaceae bacterium]|nr:hypothetical protein [Flavobacteriaceae bacterium]|tara:strand:+ start:363 stop:953 length:591 start_codon:yes stop_codon:yes gene_type:complete